MLVWGYPYIDCEIGVPNTLIAESLDALKQSVPISV